MFTNSKSVKFLIFLIILGAFLRLYLLEEKFSFDYDQEVAANASYDFLQSGKLSLIGQELSYPGFFLGPLHNWIQIIPYSVCNLKPDCVPYFFTSIGIASAYFLFVTVKAAINTKTAVISALLYLISSVVIGSERGPSSNYFLLLTSIIMLFCLNKYEKGESKYLIFGSFVGGMAIVNFNPVFIFTLIAYFFAALLTKTKNIKIILLSITAAIINIFPLLVFNFRHENMLINNLIKFTRETSSGANIVERLISNIANIVFSYFNNFLFLNNNRFYLTITFCLIVAGIYVCIKNRNFITTYLILWIICPILGFTFYNRHIPDYYFIQTLIPFIILISYVFSKKTLVFITAIFLFSYSNIANLLTPNSASSYKLKKDIVNYIILDSKNEDFNVYYNFPSGLNTGYSYLFKAAGKTPKDYSKNLYILDYNNVKQFNSVSYYHTFRNKINNIQAIGPIKIITIKQ